MPDLTACSLGGEKDGSSVFTCRTPSFDKLNKATIAYECIMHRNFIMLESVLGGLITPADSMNTSVGI